MTTDDLKPYLALLARHGLTLLAGAIAAKGLISANASTEIIDDGGAALVALGSIAWSMIQKTDTGKKLHIAAKEIDSLVAAAPATDIQQVAQAIADVHAKGSHPAIVAALVQSLGQLAMAELTSVMQPSPSPPGGGLSAQSAPAGAPASQIAGASFSPAASATVAAVAEPSPATVSPGTATQGNPSATGAAMAQVIGAAGLDMIGEQLHD
jgi:hypothetical protein